jgi:hypothetical protein
MLPVIRRKVGATAAEADSQRTPGDDHRASPSGGQYAFAEIMLKSYAKRLSQVERNRAAEFRYSNSKSAVRVLLAPPAESIARNSTR